MTTINIHADTINLRHISWKSYNLIKKKAMEQKFSWSGLLISLSIAFFVVILFSAMLNIVYQSIIKQQNYGRQEQQLNYQMYRLENNLREQHISHKTINYLPWTNIS